MLINAKPCYNLDVLCLLNVMTADDFYTSRHQEAFDMFYPQINDAVKHSVAAVVKDFGSSMFSAWLTLYVSSLPNFSECDLRQMLRSHEEIENCMNQSPYKYSKEEFARRFGFIDNAIIPLIDGLEAAGLYDFWKINKLLHIQAKCDEINNYMTQYNIENLINRYKNADTVDGSDFTVYLCCFAAPLGIKLCGNNLISDFSYPNDTILSNLTHEAFHPPYKHDLVEEAVQALSAKPWVIAAFEGQNPNYGYGTMKGFIEENIVEALGIHIVVQLGVDIDPADYFKTHDDGSHVISPHFFRYLQENPKLPSQSFEDYFVTFVRALELT